MVTPRRTSWPSRLRKLPSAVFATVVCLILVGPGLIVIPVSLTDTDYLVFPPSGFSWRWYGEIFQQPIWRNALFNSLFIAIPAAAVAIVIGAPTALAIRRLGLRYGMGLAMLPRALPVIVVGVGLYALFLRLGWVGSRLALILPHAVLGAPLVVVVVLAALDRIDPELESTARVLGAGPVTAIRTVTLPITKGPLLAGGFLAFIVSFDETLIAYFTRSSSMKTLPVLLFEQSVEVVTPTVAAASTLLISISVIALVITSGVSRRSKVSVLI